MILHMSIIIDNRNGQLPPKGIITWQSRLSSNAIHALPLITKCKHFGTDSVYTEQIVARYSYSVSMKVGQQNLADHSVGENVNKIQILSFSSDK